MHPPHSSAEAVLRLCYPALHQAVVLVASWNAFLQFSPRPMCAAIYEDQSIASAWSLLAFLLAECSVPDPSIMTLSVGL